MSDSTHNFFDTLFKAIGILGALIAFFWGIHEFRITKEREFQKDFFVEQIHVMNKVVHVTSTLSAYPDSSAEFRSADLELNRLRIGALNLFSDDEMDSKMGEFFSVYNSYKSPESNVGQDELSRIAHDISAYCNKRIQKLTKL